MMTHVRADVHPRPTGRTRASAPGRPLPGRRPRALRRIGIRVLALTGAALHGCGAPPPADPELLWPDARGYDLAEVGIRRDDWSHADSAATHLPAELVERARRAVAAVPGGLRVLAVSEDGCIDSAHAIPYLAALAERVPGLDLRLVDSRSGRALMEARPAPDGRAATPTVVLLDAAGSERGCWVERPAALQSWYLANPEELGRTQLYVAKTDWYEADGGRHVVAEFTRVLEGAAAEAPICGLPLDPAPRLPAPGTDPR